MPCGAGRAGAVRRRGSRWPRPGRGVVAVGRGRPGERPHPYIVQLLQECVENVYFTDAVEIPGLVEPEFHQSVHLEIP